MRHILGGRRDKAQAEVFTAALSCSEMLVLSPIPALLPQGQGRSRRAKGHFIEMAGHVVGANGSEHRWQQHLGPTGTIPAGPLSIFILELNSS